MKLLAAALLLSLAALSVLANVVREEQVCGKSGELQDYFWWLRRAGGRIVNGDLVPTCQHIPWQAQLRIGSAWSYSMCGGSIVNERHILTAAHCIHGVAADQVKVTVGELKYNGSDNKRMMGVERIIQHEDYSPAAQENDIAILRLSGSIEYDKCIQPVCLDDNDADPFPLKNMECIVSGWGVTAFQGDTSVPLRMVGLDTVRGPECKEKFNIPDADYVSKPNQMVCAGTPGKDSCQGDSGGPLVCLRNHAFWQVGVVSYGRACALPNYPGVYASVHHFRKWIKSNS